VRITRRILIHIGCLLALLGLSGPGRASGPPPLVRVRIPYQQRSELARLEHAGVDIWEVHPGYAVVVVSSAQEAALIRQGYQLERLGAVSPLFTFDPQYHTYPEMVAKLQGLAGVYPDLVRLLSIGQSWETAQGSPGTGWALAPADGAFDSPPFLPITIK